MGASPIGGEDESLPLALCGFGPFVVRTQIEVSMSTQPHYQPLDAMVYPRYSGIRTFMRLPHVTDLTGVDFAIAGVPFDTGGTYRVGVCQQQSKTHRLRRWVFD